MMTLHMTDAEFNTLPFTTKQLREACDAPTLAGPHAFPTRRMEQMQRAQDAAQGLPEEMETGIDAALDWCWEQTDQERGSDMLDAAFDGWANDWKPRS